MACCLDTSGCGLPAEQGVPGETDPALPRNPWAWLVSKGRRLQKPPGVDHRASCCCTLNSKWPRSNPVGPFLRWGPRAQDIHQLSLFMQRDKSDLQSKWAPRPKSKNLQEGKGEESSAVPWNLLPPPSTHKPHKPNHQQTLLENLASSPTVTRAFPQSVSLCFKNHSFGLESMENWKRTFFFFLIGWTWLTLITSRSNWSPELENAYIKWMFPWKGQAFKHLFQKKKVSAASIKKRISALQSPASLAF